MSEETARDMQLRVLLAEYDSLKAEQRSRIQQRDHLVYATLTAVAAVLTVTVAAGRWELLLLGPLACTVLGWKYVHNDHMITAQGQYVRGGMAARAAELSGLNGGAQRLMFGWELERAADRWKASRRRFQLAVTLATFCGPAAAGMVAVWALTSRTPLVLAGLVAGAVAVAGLAVQIVRYR
ncbi:hypothetical protein [Nonomuraea salmonea]|uniref:DUF2270 domain-containing protein n=1 Tax=Nonomuraea salmonea TaxID=46181 RepID=A0ABV5P328_9ACTN